MGAMRKEKPNGIGCPCAEAGGAGMGQGMEAGEVGLRRRTKQGETGREGESASWKEDFEATVVRLEGGFCVGLGPLERRGSGGGLPGARAGWTAQGSEAGRSRRFLRDATPEKVARHEMLHHIFITCSARLDSRENLKSRGRKHRRKGRHITVTSTLHTSSVPLVSVRLRHSARLL
jgi:hypothetical protein